MGKLKYIFGKLMKTPNYQKEQYRGTIKQIMKVRGLRTISLANYNKWVNEASVNGVHSLKLDIQDGYMNIYGYSKSGRCGDVINDAPAELYESVFNQVNDILARTRHSIFGQT